MSGQASHSQGFGRGDGYFRSGKSKGGGEQISSSFLDFRVK